MVDSDEGPAGMVCLGVIAGARGLRGEVKIRSFTAEPAAIAAYGPLTDASRRRLLRLTRLSVIPRLLQRVVVVCSNTKALLRLY